MNRSRNTYVGRIAIIALLFMLGAVLQGCNTDDLSCERASDRPDVRTENLAAFKKVNSTIFAEVYLHQAQEHRYEASGPQNVLEALAFLIDGERLLISSAECFTGNYVLRIDVYAPEILSATLSGIGSVRSASTLTAPHFSAVLSGVGDIDIQVDADSVYTELTGTGTAKLQGVAPVHNIVSTGVAGLQAYGLDTEETHINSNTPEDSYVQANATLSGNLLGPGNIYYRGSPVVSIRDDGPGQVVDDN